MEVNEMMKKQYFTCIGKGHGSPCLPATREDWEKLRRESWLKEMCARIERGDEQLKHRLPVWTPHCAEFRNNHRAIADAVRPLNRLMLDFDEKGHTDEIMQKLGLLQREELRVKSEEFASALPVLLVEESVRRGTHVLVELPDGMSPEEAQKLMQEATGFTPDAAVKDVSRCIYMVTEEHTKYVSERLFLATDNKTDRTEPAAEPPREEKVLDSCGPLQKEYPQEFKGVAYTSIISEFWRRTGGEPSEGERNKRLHQLAANLRAICDNNEDWLLEVMPKFGLSVAEMKSIIHSACKEPTKGSRMMDQIVESEELRVKSEEFAAAHPELQLDDDTAQADSSLFTIHSSLRKALPVGLKESLVGVPVSMHMPVLCSLMPLAAAYADQVEVRYCDGEMQKLGMMSIIYGEQASGKSVCKHAVNIWKRQFDEEDALARKREDEWKDRKKSRKANEKAPEDPKVLIRVVPVTVSCSTLLKRLKNANGHTLFSFGEELDTLRKTNGAGSWSSKYDIYRLAFDPIDSEWGQDYNSDQAESGVVKVAYNWSMLGTSGAVKKCFKGDNVENGLSSRILLAEMPDTSFAKMPRYGRRSAEDEARIQEAVTRLRAYSGYVDTPRLRKAIDQWVEQQRVIALKDIDHVKDIYRRRAAVIGFRCGVIFHLLEASPSPSQGGGVKNDKSGGKGSENHVTRHPLLGRGLGRLRESKACLDFALMMAEYCLSQQIKVFGQALQNQYVDAQTECQRYGENNSIFDQLPPTFTADDLAALKRSSVSRNTIIKIISRWNRDGWVEKVDTKRWSKVSKSPELKHDNDKVTS